MLRRGCRSSHPGLLVGMLSGHWFLTASLPGHVAAMLRGRQEYRQNIAILLQKISHDSRPGSQQAQRCRSLLALTRQRLMNLADEIAQHIEQHIFLRSKIIIECPYSEICRPHDIGYGRLAVSLLTEQAHCCLYDGLPRLYLLARPPPQRQRLTLLYFHHPQNCYTLIIYEFHR